MRRLRQKLDVPGASSLLRTVRGGRLPVRAAGGVGLSGTAKDPGEGELRGREGLAAVPGALTGSRSGLAAASLAVVLPALLILTLTVRQVVRDNGGGRRLRQPGRGGRSQPGKPARGHLVGGNRGMGASAGFVRRPAGPGHPGAAGAAGVTLIARDGTVLVDSHEDAAAMDNHADRPEIIAAFRDGYGRSQRFSATRGEELTYVAVRPAWESGDGACGGFPSRSDSPKRQSARS